MMNSTSSTKHFEVASVKTARVLKLAYAVAVGYGSYHHTSESAERQHAYTQHVA